MPGLTALRAFASHKRFLERCHMCGVVVAEGHEHVVERGTRRLLCSCQGCAVLFEADGSAKYRRVPRDAGRFASFDLPEELWASLEVPVDLVFFQKGGASGKVTAFYPSPAGVLESLLPLAAWAEVERRNPRLGSMRDDVEALLVNRVKGQREYFIAPLDECFRLIGLLRSHWEGFGGGDAVWEKAGGFFAGLRARADAL